MKSVTRKICLTIPVAIIALSGCNLSPQVEEQETSQIAPNEETKKREEVKSIQDNKTDSEAE